MQADLILPVPMADALRPLFTHVPMDRAMERLVVGHAVPDPDLVALALSVVSDAALADCPALQAGIWLYVDDLERSHTLSQAVHDATGSAWHGIMHRREGDFSNSHYWFRKAGRHPALVDIPDYEPHAFIDAVASALPDETTDLVALQRVEWSALFAWCAERAAGME